MGKRVGGANAARAAAVSGGGGAGAVRKTAHGGRRDGAGRPRKYGVPTKRVLLTLPEPLIKALDRAVEAGESDSRSELVVRTLERSAVLRRYDEDQ